ncbi:MAG: acetate uptake transporter [Treponema sp.]|nr:acetate uptake transporter [Treponema sp.]
MASTTVPAAPRAAVADPGPLGLAGFAMTTFALSIHNANLGPAATGAASAALALAIAYGGVVQLLAGMWEFMRNNTFGALAFSSYGGFWIAYYVFVQFVAPGIKDPADVGAAVTIFLLGWTIFTAYMMIASFRVSVGVAVVFVLLTITFIMLTIGAGTGSAGWTQLGGWVGLATAVAAWYSSFAGVLSATFGRPVLPNRSLAPKVEG